ncbi:hypothetical protein HOY80DRAFT_1001069 [Tuber brumale]|nr:hypothetical protein HOY80DRAFT_1001069 [Tuber brumale]
MSNTRYSSLSDRPLSRSSVARSHPSPTLDHYGGRENLTPEREFSSDDQRADWVLGDNYEDDRHTPFGRDHQLVSSHRKHPREEWGPFSSRELSSYSDPDADWSGDEFDVEDRGYYRDERRRGVYEWEHATETRIPRSGIRYVGSQSVQRRYPHIMGYRIQHAIDSDSRGRHCAGYGFGYGYGIGYERYMVSVADREGLEVELSRRRYLGGYTIRRRRYLR